MKRPFLFASVFVFGAMTILPPALLFFRSLIVDGSFSAARYVEAFTGENMAHQIQLQLNTLAVGFGAIFFSLLIGLPLAFLLARTRLPGRPLLWGFCLLPLLIPPYLGGIAWTRVVTGLSGYFGVVLMLGVSYFPIPVFLVARSLATVDRSLEEASIISRGLRSSWFPITWRLATPAILASSLFVFVIAVSDTGTADYFTTTTSEPFNVFATHVFFEYTKSTEAAAVAALPLILLCAVGVILISSLEGRGSFRTLGGQFREPVEMELGLYRWPAAIGSTAILGCLTLFPVLVFLQWALDEPVAARDGTIQNAFLASLDWAGPDLVRSFMNAAAAALIVIVVGFGPAYLLARLPRTRRKWGTLFALLPFSVPAVALAVGYLRFFNHGDFIRDTIYTGQGLVILGLAARFLPLGILCMGTAISRVDTQLEDAARLCQNGSSRFFSKILFPLVGRGTFVTGVIVFAFAMRELDTISLFDGASNTIVMRIFNGIHFSQDALVAAQCLWLLVATILPIVLGRLLITTRHQTG